MRKYLIRGREVVGFAFGLRLSWFFLSSPVTEHETRYVSFLPYSVQLILHNHPIIFFRVIIKQKATVLQLLSTERITKPYQLHKLLLFLTKMY